jgi:hypothetical protein
VGSGIWDLGRVAGYCSCRVVIAPSCHCLAATNVVCVPAIVWLDSYMYSTAALHSPTQHTVLHVLHHSANIVCCTMHTAYCNTEMQGRGWLWQQGFAVI